MEVQTQIIDQSQVSGDEINAQARVADFKQLLSEARLARVTALQKRQAQIDRINAAKYDRDNLISLFKSEAKKQYPDIETEHLAQALSSVSKDHPLQVLWSNYERQIEKATDQISSDVSDLQAVNDEIYQAEFQEKRLSQAYQAFSESSPVQVPSLDDVLNELGTVEAIPYVEESSTIVELPAIDLLSPAAADMVTLQTMQAEKLEDEVNQTRAMTAPMTDKTWNIGLIVGGVALLYILFGGSKKGT
jgi:hypothetical protein